MGRSPTLKLSAAGCAVVLATAVLILGRPIDGSEAITGADGIDPLVVGGEDATRGRFRYMVNLVDNTGNIRCGGTLIHPFVVLTAAHCGAMELSHVTIGRYNIDDGSINGDASSEYEARTVQQTAKHPLYLGFPSVQHDIMLMRLDAQSNKPTVAINWDGSADLNKDLAVLGWGTTITKFQSDVLQMAHLDYISNDACNNEFAWDGQVTDDMMCAQRGIKDSCSGDSGGPLIIPGSSDEASDVQVGVVSGGLMGDCTNPSYPGVYSRIAESWDAFLNDTLLDWGFDQDITPCSCGDDPDYRHKGRPNRHCRWVSRKPQRCNNKANAEGCPQTCGTCDCPGTCEDDPNHQFKGNAKKNCLWVSKKAEKRCKRSQNQEGCPKTCGTC